MVRQGAVIMETVLRVSKALNGDKHSVDSPADLLKLADPSKMTVIKREGNSVPYDDSKIYRAVSLCFSSLLGDETQISDFAHQVTIQVDSILRLKSHQMGNGVPAPIGIEAIQDIVESQLMALGHHDAARHYILYRDERRRVRDQSKSIPQEMRDFFRDGCSLFRGTNRLLQEVQAFDKFSRFQWDLKRREIWPESVDRTISYYRKHVNQVAPGAISEELWAEMHHFLLHQKATGSMRGIQMAGPALDVCQTGVFNCAFLKMDSPESMAEDLYLLMQGVGVGFSVEEEHAVDQWPRIHARRDCAPVEHIVEDDTEAWCDAVKFGIHHWLDGVDVKFDLSLIRPEGAILRTKGGRASGPGPLRDLLNFDREIIFGRQKKRLRSIDIHDMTCMLHRIGQMGGVRRASGLSLSERCDLLMRHCKDGEFFRQYPWRNQANNSAVYEEKPSAIDFMEEWMALARSGSGERGIFNRGSIGLQIPKRRKLVYFACNPCGEIYLRHGQFCNLSIAIADPDDTLRDLMVKVRIATIWGTIQATMTRFRYLRPFWKENTEDEALLGVDILGHMDCKILRPGAPGREEILQKLRQEVRDTNLFWARKFGINQGAALTCGKPSGDSSVFFDKAAGLKAWHGTRYIRRLRFADRNPIAQVLKDAGVPWERDYDKTGMFVFEFPCRAPDDAIILGQMSAVEQLENWKTWKLNFTEHNPSCTVYVRENEWLEAGNWVYQNWDYVGGLSFYPFSDAVYPQAPYQAISDEEYKQRMQTMPTEIDWSRIMLYEKEDETTLSGQLACTANGCDV
jgi:ribonucleoside-triphosphate reductase